MLSQGHIIDGIRQLKAALPGMWTAHPKYSRINDECFPDVYVDSIISNFVGNDLFDAIQSSFPGVIKDYFYRPFYNGIVVNAEYEIGSVDLLVKDYLNLESKLEEISGDECGVTVDTISVSPDRIMLEIRIKLDNMKKLYEKGDDVVTSLIETVLGRSFTSEDYGDICNRVLKRYES